MILLSRNSCFVKKGGRFFQILRPSHNFLTLTTNEFLTDFNLKADFQWFRSGISIESFHLLVKNRVRQFLVGSQASSVTQLVLLKAGKKCRCATNSSFLRLKVPKTNIHTQSARRFEKTNSGARISSHTGSIEVTSLIKNEIDFSE